MEESPIIIYGAPRSGTTYVQMILNHQPDLFISLEIRLFAWLHRTLKVTSQQEEFLFQDREKVVAHFRAAYPDLVRDFYRKLAPRARYWGDKNPHYASSVNRGCLETIVELFPGARFIHVIRDGRDVACSLVRKRWAKFDAAHQLWIDHIDIGTAFGATQTPKTYFELRYEELVRDDVAMMQRVFDFLDIEMDPGVKDACLRQQDKRTIVASGATRDLSRGVAASEWSTTFTPPQQRQSLELVGKHLVKYGYETEESLARLQQEIGERLQSAVPHPPAVPAKS
jgi:hypothetical protein